MENNLETSQIKSRISSAINSDDWTVFNRRLTEKRQSWYKMTGRHIKVPGSDVRRAYHLFLIEYLGVSPEEVPVVYEDESRIVWHSHNWCPVVEACQRGGYDTRVVCKNGYEKSVQAFIELINPRLRFTRNYDRIRPYTEYCEEEFYLKD